MAPSSSVTDVAAAGQQAKGDAAAGNYNAAAVVGFTVALGKAVGTGGQFDDQRMGPQSAVLPDGIGVVSSSYRNSETYRTSMSASMPNKLG